MQSAPSDVRWRIVALVAGAAALYATLSLVAVLALSPKPSPTPTPLFQPPPTPSGVPWPTADPRLNFAGGDFIVVDGWNGCKIRVQLAATSRMDFTAATGTIVLTAIGPDSCQGYAIGRVTCLLVTGNFAKLSGWLDQTSGIFTIGNVVQATLTVDDPQTYGPPINRAGIGLADGSPECPPNIEGKGPQIISGTLQISPARPPA